MDVFSRLAPFIQDFIYQNKWQELRGIQVAACEVIFDSDDNLLLSSGTASGKTEAAFLPVLTKLYENPSKSVGVMYISPLKALINDQFKRLEQLLIDSHIPVTKWHGDASQSKKDDLTKNPEGILQITPESLESLIINKRGACLKMFSDLRFIIIDEVHYFMRDIRGVQLLCCLERLQQLTGVEPRRIGLSATLGDVSLAQTWLNTGSKRVCAAPITDEGKQRIRLHVERFVNYADARDLVERDSGGNVVNSTSGDIGNREHFEYLFKMTMDKKTILFTNSREEAEFVLANLREIALRNKAPDVYRVHHGNVSALIREATEDEMKSNDEKIVTGATVTLELGIDIGSLDQVVQVGAPLTVSSFAQRLGRSGRRGQTPQLLFTFVESLQINSADILGPINWEFIRTIAIIELYTKDHWLEPINPRNHAYNLLYHQTMSHLKSAGELSPAALASVILSLGSFKHISQEDYRLLLAHLIEIQQLERSERGGLLIGREGEKVVNSHKFLSVFLAPEYLLVKDENRTIGTVDKIYPVGMRFALAGLTWETVEVNEKSKVIFVKRVPGISLVDWDVEFEIDLHTGLVQKIRQVLLSDEDYPYLSERSRERLAEIRYIARNSGILENLVTPLSDKKYAIFPWVGTRQLFTLHYALMQRKIKNQLPWITSVFLEVIFNGSAAELEAIVYDILNTDLDLYSLPLPDNIQIKSKYSEFIPMRLLRKQYIEDYLDIDGLRNVLQGGSS
ncbi:MAG: DEAD/DEAH box helicase [Coriobacteriales bacterium]|jgi:ATP-dependent Lhr-like helicase|nr:DEAD/DEAH box helicase [Coriobacteriales bacterium]